jgi:hypothetical protein
MCVSLCPLGWVDIGSRTKVKWGFFGIYQKMWKKAKNILGKLTC